MNIPASITSAGQVGRFSREVREALSALNRKIPPPVQARSMPKAVKDHPFRVVPEGDEHVTIKTGKVRYWQFPTEGDFDSLEYPGYARVKVMDDVEEFEVTGTGSLWLRIRTGANNINGGQFEEDGSIYGTDTLTVPFANLEIIFSDGDPPETSPGDREVFVEVAKVELDDGVAKVTDQVLDENVWLSIQHIQFRGS